MKQSKLGKGLAALSGTAETKETERSRTLASARRIWTERAAVPAVLATPAAAANDHTGAAVRIEQTRYERAILDFEASVRRERDRMSAEHFQAMRVILGQ